MKLIERDGHHYFEVNGREYPAEQTLHEDVELQTKGITHDGWLRSRGCHVRFESGWSVSMIWGNLTYSSNRAMGYLFGQPDPEFSEEPTAVEILVMDHTGEPADDETVLGWVTADELERLFALLSTLPTNAQFSYSMMRRDDDQEVERDSVQEEDADRHRA